jgi:hypothetical protein
MFLSSKYGFLLKWPPLQREQSTSEVVKLFLLFTSTNCAIPSLIWYFAHFGGYSMAFAEGVDFFAHLVGANIIVNAFF